MLPSRSTPTPPATAAAISTISWRSELGEGGSTGSMWVAWNGGAFTMTGASRGPAAGGGARGGSAWPRGGVDAVMSSDIGVSVKSGMGPAAASKLCTAAVTLPSLCQHQLSEQRPGCASMILRGCRDLQTVCSSGYMHG